MAIDYGPFYIAGSLIYQVPSKNREEAKVLLEAKLWWLIAIPICLALLAGICFWIGG